MIISSFFFQSGSVWKTNILPSTTVIKKKKKKKKKKKTFFIWCILNIEVGFCVYHVIKKKKNGACENT